MLNACLKASSSLGKIIILIQKSIIFNTEFIILNSKFIILLIHDSSIGFSVTFRLEFPVESAEIMEDCPWEMMMFCWKTGQSVIVYIIIIYIIIDIMHIMYIYIYIIIIIIRYIYYHY